MMKKIVPLFLAGVMILSLAACGQKAPKDDGEYPVTVGDFVQQTRPEKIVTLTPGATEMVLDLGYEELVAGVSSYCDLPASVTDSSRMGSAYSPDIEAIAASGATLVVTTVQLTEADLVALQQKGVGILLLARADTPEGIKANYEALGKVLGGNITGAAAAATVTGQIDTLLNKAKETLAAATEPVKAVLLTASPYQMATGDSVEGKLLAAVGFQNCAAEETGWLYPEEKKDALTPDVIFCADEDTMTAAKESKEYKASAAVKNEKVEVIDFTAFQCQSLRLFRVLSDMADFAVK